MSALERARAQVISRLEFYFQVGQLPPLHRICQALELGVDVDAVERRCTGEDLLRDARPALSNGVIEICREADQMGDID